ncbi:zf-CCCH type zinc finger protein, Prp19 complex subunit, RNA-binding Cwf2 [Schizosaccharomyces osmophilus]|uniref:Zf-CCCH type zinc finger protein, Prp19 complex subunit, RNA-binding Cwf2 n=1 Tax=Schizosaccharomyces osmophilus TaxID=2545709 RepID=A0AAE9W9E2_9SCHI|nr:zf-CCCH type zinc finger protein, Prp19 complex subunit, RNA-binding Cwf2 [Schizosaccharomyces osmophilus]WBW72116.1 zf-CCCH type zinc finger protein, Prp19 complex subunit, RNA-binding Cwf2 [Schizosaccharomyces osmophilus]
MAESEENYGKNIQETNKDDVVKEEIVEKVEESGKIIKKVKKVVKRKKRPARKQIEERPEFEMEAPQQGQVYNIWYNKWSGGNREDPLKSQLKSDTRCNIESDSGYTKADKIPGSYFCLYFARGMCSEGSKCEFLHRLPNETDFFNANVDCFGREKHADYRDDMGGVGSFLRQNHTLYVGGIQPTDDIEEIVARHFAEWGDIERIRVLNSRGIAFVTYVNEANAQFAKEAMAHQSLDNDECLNCRWATLDPNPASQARNQRRLEERAADVVKKLLPKEFLEDLQDSKTGKGNQKKRKLELEFGLKGYVPSDDLLYADGSSSIRNQKSIEASSGPVQQTEVSEASADATEQTSASSNKFLKSDVLKDLRKISQSSQQKSPALVAGYDSDED